MHFVEYIQKRSSKHILVGLLLGVCAFLIYHSALRVGFLSDDWHAVSVARDTENIFRFFTTNIVGERGGSSYGPIYNLAMYIEYHLFHLHAGWYHAVSVVFLAATAFMLYGFVRRMWNNTILAYGAAFLFLVLPSHVEAVVWISGQPHLIATLLYISALYCYTVFSSQKNTRYYILACMCVLGSLLTKEIGITFIVPFLVIDYRFARISVARQKIKESIIHILRYYMPLLVLGLAYLYVRNYATGVILGYYGSSSLTISVAAYIRMGVEMTVGMVFSHPLRDVIAEAVFAHTWIATLSFVGIGGLIISLCRKNIHVLVLIILLYSTSLLPYLSLQYNAVSNEGERYTYLPSLYIVIAIAFVVYQATAHLRRNTVLYSILCTSIALMCVHSVLQKNTEWVRAGNIVRETLPTIQSLGLDPERPVVFVGLPDRLAGAQLLRNGTFLAIDMLGYGHFAGDRILVSPLLRKEYTKDDELIRIEYCGSTTITSCMRSVVPGERLFTGLPYSEVYGVKATLKEFKNADQMGVEVLLEKTNPEVQIVYFHHNTFQLLEG